MFTEDWCQSLPPYADLTNDKNVKLDSYCSERAGLSWKQQTTLMIQDIELSIRPIFLCSFEETNLIRREEVPINFMIVF